MILFDFSGRITQLMEHLDVFISVKPKPKQPSKVRFYFNSFCGDINCPRSLLTAQMLTKILECLPTELHYQMISATS